MTLRIRKYSWQLAPGALRDIRQAVFIDEQQVPAELEWDDTDAIADHFIALTPDNTPVAVARLYPSIMDTAHIGRMAVLPAYRGRGYGEQLLRDIMTDAAGDYQDLYLSAQTQAVAFYQRSGFHVCSGTYDDAGIPHVDMRCLAPQLITARWQDHRWPMVAGKDDRSWVFESEGDLIDAMDSLASQARQSLWIYDQFLDHDRYDRFRLREIISAVARRHRLSDVRLLIHDDRPLVQRRHQLVELMRRLPSKIELRLINQDYPSEAQAFLLADRHGLVYRHQFDKPDGFAQFSDPGHSKRLRETYQRMWEAGRTSLELRELPL